MKPILIRKLIPYIILAFGVSYGVWPVDAIPDVPVIGWLDDLGVIGTAIFFALRFYSKNKKQKENK